MQFYYNVNFEVTCIYQLITVICEKFIICLFVIDDDGPEFVFSLCITLEFADYYS